MIDRQHNQILIECDTCEGIFEGNEGDDFSEVWTAAKREGWKTRPVGNDWLHFCSTCKPLRK